MANEPFDLKKWLTGFIDPTTWSKSIVYFIMIVAILFGVLTIYRAYFMKTGSNVSRPWVLALPGSTVGDIDQHSDQKLEQKRKWWFPIPYISIFGEYKTEGNRIDEFKAGYGVQGGIRWDF